MGKKLTRYKSNIRIQYDIYSDNERAYQYNRGYITGLNDGEAINSKSGYALVELNCSLRKGGK